MKRNPNTDDKPLYKRKRVWLGAVLAVGILGNLLPEVETEESSVEQSPAVEVAAETTSKTKETAAVATKPKATEEKKAEPIADTPLNKAQVLDKFALEPSNQPYENGTFSFVGNRTDTADYYSLADTDEFRNASVIFKDGEIARVKLIPADGVKVADIFAEFGITDKPRELGSEYVKSYEVALVPLYWSQNVELYPFEQ